MQFNFLLSCSIASVTSYLSENRLKTYKILNATKMQCQTKSDIYLKTTAQSAIREKEEITYRLRVNGIQSILTTPENLNINVINKYLEIKNKLMI